MRHMAAAAGAAQRRHRSVGGVEIPVCRSLGDISGRGDRLLREAGCVGCAFLLPIVLDLLERSLHGLGFRLDRALILGGDSLRYLALGGDRRFHPPLVIRVALCQQHKESNSGEKSYQNFRKSHSETSNGLPSYLDGGLQVERLVSFHARKWQSGKSRAESSNALGSPAAKQSTYLAIQRASARSGPFGYGTAIHYSRMVRAEPTAPGGACRTWRDNPFVLAG